jgi:hypothetical protein
MRIDLGRKSDAVLVVNERLAALDRGLRTGDVPARKYPRLRQEALAELGRALIAPHLEPGERILAEHHAELGHLSLPLSPFRETAQAAVSYYLTDRRLFRWCFQDRKVPEAEPLEGWEERLEALSRESVAAVRNRFQWRWSEAGTGLAVAALALLLRSHLRVTFWALLALGALAVLHALVIPARKVEIVPRNPAEASWTLWAPGRRSGRHLLGLLAGDRRGAAP